MRAVLGFDLHRLVPGRKCIICGVEIPHSKGLLGHSDADVGLHALIDALLSGAGLPDIGTMFPDSDPKYKNIDSALLLKKVLTKVKALGIKVEFVDFTFICDEPKLSPYYEKMRERVSEFLEIEPGCISFKAKTTEGLGWGGEKEAVACLCLTTLSS